MAESKEGEIHWYEPELRAVFPLEGLKISRSLRQTIRKKIFDIRLNTSFESVMRRCADREETWISEPIIQSYCELTGAALLSRLNRGRAANLPAGFTALRSGELFSENRCLVG